MKDIFSTWLGQHFPDRKDKVLNRVRDMRGGKRGRGEGPWADHLRALFQVTSSRLGLNRPPALSTASFVRPPDPRKPQMDLFGSALR